jgi:dolichyl-phosphate beta-glucosyltransferase
MTRFLAAWFARLDTESRFRLSHFAFEDPSSPARVAPPSLFAAPTKSLSVVIPAYNEEDRLPNTLEETLAYLQRRRDRQGPNFTYEVVIVDDGSRDATVASANRFVRRHGFDAVRVLRLPANRGKGYAVKAGMLCCRGRDVLFMDADGATRVSEVEALEAQLQEVLKDSSQKLEKMEAVRTAATTPPSPVFKGGVGGDEEFDDRRKDGASGMARRGAPGYYARSDRRRGGIGGGEEDTRLGFVLGSRAHLQDAALAKRTWIRNFLMHGFHFLVTLVVGGTIRDTQCGFKVS